MQRGGSTLDDVYVFLYNALLNLKFSKPIPPSKIMQNRPNIAGSENLIDSIPKILFWAWSSLFLGLLATFAMTLFIGHAAGLKTHFIPSLLGTQRTNTRIRGGVTHRKPSDTRQDLVLQGRKILRSAAQND